MNRHSFRAGLLAALITFAGALSSTGVQAQDNAARNGQRITPHFKDAEIGQVIEAVAAATGKTIIPDIRVRAQVTMLSNTPMTPAQFAKYTPSTVAGISLGVAPPLGEYDRERLLNVGANRWIQGLAWAAAGFLLGALAMQLLSRLH